MACTAHATDPRPDDCFGCKLSYWRSNGAPGVVYANGKDFFHESTIRERQDHAIAEAKANGNDVRLVNPTYDKWSVG